MSWLKVLSYVSLVLSISIIRVKCNSCEQDRFGNLECHSFEDLFNYPNPEKQTRIKVTNVNSSESDFICDEPSFEKFHATTEMIFDKAGVRYIGTECFTGLKALTLIDLQNNELSSLEMDIFTPAKETLELIYLNHNYLFRLDFTHVQLPELIYVEAYYNRLRSVKIKDENLPKIRVVELYKNLIIKFQIESKTMQRLDLSYNRIKTFNGSNLILPNLTSINLNDNALTVITSEMFANVPNLENINLSHNRLHTVSFTTVKPNAYINLKDNRLRTFNNLQLKVMGNSSNLRLDLNKISILESIGESNYEHIESFYCFACFLHTIEPYFFADTFKNIDWLEMPKNYLTTANIFQAYDEDLKFIKILISDNKIKKIGKNDFKRLTAVTKFYLNDNEIALIEEGSFDKMQKLEILDISNNLLLQLPANLFGNIASLKNLDLQSNNMAFFHIPGLQEETGIISITNSTLNNIESLTINKNPLQCQCVVLIRSWAKTNGIELTIDDKNVRNGINPSCIVNNLGCQANIGKEFVKDYWHLFNDKKYSNIFEDTEPDIYSFRSEV